MHRGGLPETRLAAYRDYLRARPKLSHRGFDGERMSEHSVNTYLRPLKQFGNWVDFEGWIEGNPPDASYVPLLPGLGRVQRILKMATPEQVRTLLDATAGSDPLSLRDRAMILMDWDTGERSHDLWRLDIDSVDLTTGLITIVDSKGDRDRQVRLGELGRDALARYLREGRPAQLRAIKPARRGQVSAALFLSDAAGTSRNPSGRLTTNGIYQLFTRRWHEAGGSGGFGAHRLRHGSRPCSSKPTCPWPSWPPGSAARPRPSRSSTLIRPRWP